MLDIDFRSIRIQSSIDSIFNYYKYVVLHHFDSLVFVSENNTSSEDVLNELVDLVLFNKMYYKNSDVEVKQYLKKAGYSNDVIRTFERKLGFCLPKRLMDFGIPVNNDSILSACFDRIFSIVENDLYHYIEDVISDSENDPKFSAVTLLDKLEDAVIINNKLYGKSFSGINTYLQYLGYPLNAINILEYKKNKEQISIYNSEV